MRFLTAGESHGPGLTVIVEGLPRGIPISEAAIARDLARRQAGYGRGPRAAGEPEVLEITAGVRRGRTTGAPVAVFLRHRHWETWRPVMDPAETPDGVFHPAGSLAGVEAAPARPRPGHADLAGAIKYGLDDLRDVIERASARETAARTAAGALARSFLAELGVAVYGWVASIGAITATHGLPPRDAAAQAEDSPVRTPDPEAGARMVAAIDAARAAGDTLGGTFIIAAEGLPPGLGSYGQWDLRLDARLAAAVMSIPSVKGVEIGDGFAAAALPGSLAHDAILPDAAGGFRRETNRAGGLEGGLTNGETLLLRAAVKPIPTLRRSLPSVDLRTGEPAVASVERSDVCVVPAASVVAEAMTAWVLAGAFLEKFGGDTLAEVQTRLADFRGRRPPWRDV